MDALAEQCDRFGALSLAGQSRILAGPTGERNVYTLLAREAVLCLASDDHDRLVQLAAVLAVGSHAVWPSGRQSDDLVALLPAEVRQKISIARDWRARAGLVKFDAALFHGDGQALVQVMTTLADRPGPIIGLQALSRGSVDIPLERLVVERALSLNTAAAGGNASLMTVG